MNISHNPLNYDIDKIRSQFPFLDVRPYGKKIIYFDNAASAQKPKIVLDRLTQFYTNEYANVHRGLHYLANAATEAYEDARSTVCKFLNAVDSEEIIFTRGATEALNMVASSFGNAHIRAGDEIILSTMEHHSNIVPWHYLRENHGAIIQWIEPDLDGRIDIVKLSELINKKTKIIALTHMSNVLGFPVQIKEIAKMAHAHNVPILIDGSQGAVHLDVDVQALDVDFYVFTGHKLYGPTGIGVLYAKKPWLEELPPYSGGGEMINTVTRDRVTYAMPPQRFEAGTPPVAQAVGLATAIKYLDSIGREAIRQHEKQLTQYASSKLSEMKHVKIYGNAPDKGPIISFNLNDAHAHDVATIIDHYGIAVRAGTHCAMPLMSMLGASSTCRASFGLYNTFEEIDDFVEGLAKAQSLFS
jgi:cysteine desulfurase/selenocysteine lyase